MKREWIFFIGIFILGSFLLITQSNITSSVGEVSYCAERTIDGAWCQNVALSKVDQNYRKTPSSCETTSYCKLGTCVDSSQGTCEANTPERVCQDNKGVWFNQKKNELAQCQLGCCLLGDQASFTTQTRCKAIASDYSVQTEFRSDIRTEVECIAAANPEDEGACVFDTQVQKDCKRLTRGECQTANGEFHEGFLCSDETLATNCGPSQQTTCLEDRDEVYFLDTCGNVANIYDSSKINDKEYWSKIKDRSESCNPDSNNANSATCGSCSYLGGSVCKNYDRSDVGMARPRAGDNICADLSCEYKGKNFEHGETWCGDAPGAEENLPGSEHYRLVCYNGEVSFEQCAAFRQEVCIEDSIEDFSFASCRANLWRDCVLQDNQEDCENADKRDCQWLEGKSLLRDEEDGTYLFVNRDGELVHKSEQNTGEGASCVPLYAPGFDFWNGEESEAEELCLIASETCLVKFEKDAGDLIFQGDWDCKENCECLGENWAEERNNICLALGDCGSSKNYIGVQGYNKPEDAVEVIRRASDEQLGRA